MKLAATGFGPFGSVTENPSQALAESLGLPFSSLDVSFAAVDDLVDSLPRNSGLLMLGVRAKASSIVLETLAKNQIGATPDVTGQVFGPGPIDPKAPSQLGATLWSTDEIFLSQDWEMGVDAGDYLCNYLSFQVFWKRPDIQAGFVHVPPFDVLDRDIQLERLRGLASILQREGVHA